MKDCQRNNCVGSLLTNWSIQMDELFNYDKILDSSVRLEKTIMFSKIAGITFDNRQVLASHCYKGMKLTLCREYDSSNFKLNLFIFVLIVFSPLANFLEMFFLIFNSPYK